MLLCLETGQEITLDQIKEAIKNSDVYELLPDEDGDYHYTSLVSENLKINFTVRVWFDKSSSGWSWDYPEEIEISNISNGEVELDEIEYLVGEKWCWTEEHENENEFESKMEEISVLVQETYDKAIKNY